MVFPAVLLVLVHGPLQLCFSGLRQVGKPLFLSLPSGSPLCGPACASQS